MEFKLISDFDNKYEISKTGILRNAITKKPVSICIVDGYPSFVYRCKGERKLRKIHRLIAIAFIPNPFNKPVVNHLDGNRINFNIDNLEWATLSENELHSYRVLGKKSNTPWVGKFNEDNPGSKPVKQFELNRAFVKIWPSISEVARSGFTLSNISRCCNGKQKSHKGYFWNF